MPRLILLTVLFAVCLNTRAERVISFSEVYAQALLIEKETELVARHFPYVHQPVQPEDINFDAQPRHVWQKAYMLQMKLVAFRRKQQLDGFTPVEIEAHEQLDPRYAWAQTQRVLTEIRIIRKLLGVPGEAGAAPVAEDKKPVDVYNLLARIEAQWNALGGSGLDPSYTFAEALRLNDETDSLLDKLEIFHNAYPPAKNPNDTPDKALAQAFLVLEQVQRLQKTAAMDLVDFSAFHKPEGVTPSYVFNLVSLLVAEVQPLKDRAGLNHVYPAAASYQQGKTPADVRQLLGYIANKLALIKHL